MSFSVADQRTGLEWRGTSFSTVFAQRRNLAGPTSCACWPTWSASTAWPGLSGRPAARPRDAGGGAGPAPLVARIPGLVPRPAGLVDLVGRPLDLHPDPGATFARFFERHGLLPRRPAEVAHGRRRVEALRRAILRPLRRGPTAPSDTGRQDHRHARWSRGVSEAGSKPTTTSCSPPTATRPWPPVGARPDGARDTRCAALPAQPGHPAHRRQPAAHRATGLGQLELPPPRGRSATRPR